MNSLRAARPFALVVLAYVALAVFWAGPSAWSPLTRAPDLGDPLHLGWTMAWDAHALVHQPFALFDANTFHPYPRSLAFADHLLPEALMVAPVFWATGNALFASNVAVMIALAFSATAMFLLVRRLTGSLPAAFLAGLVYAFTSLTQHEVPRVHVLNVQWWPLALLFLDRFRVEGRMRDAALTAGALALQGLSGTYYLVYTALLTPLWFVVVFATSARRPSWVEIRRLLLACLLAMAVGAAILWPYAVQFGAMGFEKGFSGGADVLSFLEPAPRSWLWSDPAARVGRSELPHFLGFIALLAAAAGVARLVLGRAPAEARPIAWAALLTATLGFVFALGPLIVLGGRAVAPGPYDLLYRLVPPLRGMAGPERFGMLVPLGVAVLVGLAAAAALDRVDARARWPLAALAGVLLVAEQWTVPRPAAEVPAGADLPGVYRWLAEDRRTPMVELPLYPDRARKQWAAYLYFSTIHWRPIPIGRTSFYPPAHDFLARMLATFPDEVSLAALDRLGIDTVVVHPRVWSAEERASRLAALESHPRLHLERAFTDSPDPRFAALGLGEERVYRVTGPPGDLPAPCTPRRPLPREGWTFRSTGINKEDRVRDGDRRTAWHTARPQKPGDQLEARLDSETGIAAVGLGLSYPYDEIPRNLVLFLEDGSGARRRVDFADGPAEQRAVLDALVAHPRDAEWVLRVPPQRVRAVRLQIAWREEDPSWPAWSLSELQIYQECE